MKTFIKTSLFAVLIGIVGYGVAQEWAPVGTGINSQTKDAHNNVYDMIVFRDELYVVGSFTVAGDKTANYIAKWNGSDWTPVGGGFNAVASSLCIYKEELYVTGWFTRAGDIDASYIARWNGTEWNAVGNGFNSRPYDMVVYKDELHVAGEFTKAGGQPARNIAKWNGTSWSSLAKGVDVVRKMAVYKDVLYTGGWAFEKHTKGINSWNGTKWLPLSDDLTGVPDAMLVYKNHLYFGGYFPADKKKAETCIGQFDGTQWLKTGTKGTNGHIYSMLDYNGELYVAGFFNEVEGIPASNVAKWNGSSWMSFTPGLHFHPHALVIYKGDLYAGGGYSNSETSEVGKTMIAKIRSVC